MSFRIRKRASPPASPPPNYLRIYALDDDTLYTKTSGGVESPLGGLSDEDQEYFDLLVPSIKYRCRVATSGDEVLSGLIIVDGTITLGDGDRVLVRDQADDVENGIYVAHSGAWTRAEDFDAVNEISTGTLIHVLEGDSMGNTLWHISAMGGLFPGGSVQFSPVGLDYSSPGEVDDSGFAGNSTHYSPSNHGHAHGSNLSNPFAHNPATDSADGFYSQEHFVIVRDLGYQYKKSVRVVVTSNITLSTLQTIDGVSLADGDRVLVRSQTTGANNGIYYARTGSWDRANDFDADAEVGQGLLIPVTEGTAHKSSVWMLETAGSIIVGTTALVFRCVAQPVLDRLFLTMDATDAPNSSNWAVNAAAAVQQDTVNAALLVARFDDTVEEGRGFRLNVPQRATDIALTFVSRAQTAPAATRTVGLKWYIKSIPNNSAISGSYTSAVLTDISIPNNANFQYVTQSLSLSTLGLTAGLTHLIELTRINPTAGTELVGDWNLLELLVRFR